MSEDVSREKSAKKASKALLIRTVFLLLLCGLASFAVLAFRLYDIQINNNGHYEALALNAQLRKSSIVATRGTIFDTNGKILAISASVENVFISPLEIALEGQDIGLIADGLSAILGVERSMIIERAARTSSQYELIKLKVEMEETDLVRAFIREHRLRGVHLEPNSKRYYPNNSLASQVLGFVGTDNIGLEGLEQRYEALLSGVNGRRVRLTNARGTDLRFAEYEDFYDAQHGNDITLTIDSSIQYYVEKHLAQAIVDYDVINGAMCIAMNPKTGAILAVANYPNFDPNDFLRLSDKEFDKISHIEEKAERDKAINDARHRQWRNRSLANTYEPGSVFKILTYAMALEENKAVPESVIDCSGSMVVSGRRDKDGAPIPLRCWRIWGHGAQSLTQAMENSCNIVCVELGLRLGAQTFYKYIDAFGLRSKTGLDNAAEGNGIWWTDNVFLERDNHSQLASASFGQSFTVTPIQMITAAAATVNGGYLMQPYIVQQVTDSAGIIVEANEPTVLRQVISSETSAMMRSMLAGVVDNGSGKNAQVRGYSLGGKTGTSENLVQIATSAEGANKDYIVSFLGFAPADDPEIMILLLLDTPSHDTRIYISGGSMAAPVVGNMMADILPLSLNVRPKYSESDLKDINIDVPRITGRNVEHAKTMLTGLGFEVRVVGDGETVTGQLPAPNAHVSSGTTVVIYADEDVDRGIVTVPQLSGMPYATAKQTLESRGMFIRATGAPKSDSKVRVSVQSIQAGSETAYGSVVEVTLIDRDIIEERH